jgi:hypothetical protein
MPLLAPMWIRFVLPLTLVLFPASTAHAQRIPDAAIFWVGASLLAPFLAVPVKLGILRLLALDIAGSRLWMMSVIEWILWFPVGFFVLRYGGLWNKMAPCIAKIVGLLTTVVWWKQA